MELFNTLLQIKHILKEKIAHEKQTVKKQMKQVKLVQ